MTRMVEGTAQGWLMSYLLARSPRRARYAPCPWFSLQGTRKGQGSEDRRGVQAAEEAPLKHTEQKELANTCYPGTTSNVNFSCRSRRGGWGELAERKRKIDASSWKPPR